MLASQVGALFITNPAVQVGVGVGCGLLGMLVTALVIDVVRARRRGDRTTLRRLRSRLRPHLGIGVWLLIIAAAGVTNTYAMRANPELAWATGSGWFCAFGCAVLGYQLGWGTRGSYESGRSAGRWIAYPVDADGIPAAPPVSGHLVVDEHDIIGRRS
ncbi:MAG: hypothetical protein ACRDQU_12430 [Pseudonocardiaceae bacterium]